MNTIQDCEISCKKDYDIHECFLLILTWMTYAYINQFFSLPLFHSVDIYHKMCYR